MANYCENTCNLSNTQEQIKLGSRRYRCTCFDGFHGPCCNDKVPPPRPKYDRLRLPTRGPHILDL